ncbi:MAG: hypothetical protein HQK85_12450 [Nitrospinae bacterium]|nr:hypothetical protein [Nitrospinota bacterium]
MWGKFGPTEFANHRDEYLLHIGSGIFLGITLHVAATVLIAQRNGSWRAVYLAIAGVVTPFLFIVLIHQTRVAINDGPGTVSLGFGLLLSAVASYLAKRG